MRNKLILLIFTFFSCQIYCQNVKHKSKVKKIDSISVSHQKLKNFHKKDEKKIQEKKILFFEKKKHKKESSKKVKTELKFLSKKEN